LPGVYTIDIQQGNIVDQAMVDQLRPHMSKRQVLYIMGSPMLDNPFQEQRWDYIFSEHKDGEDREQKRVTLFFDNDQIVGIQGDLKPSAVETTTKPTPELTVNVPKRNLERTLWEKLTGIFDYDDEELDKKSAAARTATDNIFKKSK
jgi:outer membrane protein assembly factor BamE